MIKLFIYSIVGKVKTLALLIILSVLSSCGNEEPMRQAPDASRAIDSAYRAVWSGLSIVRTDSLEPSWLFDSIYRRILPAVEIEREKRTLADSLARTEVLDPKNLRDAVLRRNNRSLLRYYDARDTIWNIRLAKLRAELERTLVVALDTLYGSDTASTREARSKADPQLLLVPPMRHQYDSVQRGIRKVYVELLAHIDSVGRRVQIDTVVRFYEEADKQRYEQVIARLESLAKAEVELIGRMEGNTATRGSGVSGHDSTNVGSQPPHVRRSWPRSVRVQ